VVLRQVEQAVCGHHTWAAALQLLVLLVGVCHCSVSGCTAAGQATAMLTSSRCKAAAQVE
jgi:hypothetical protein